MAVSGSRDWSVTNNDVIKGALRKLNALASGETPSADETSEAREELNKICKRWSGRPNFRNAGFQVWNRESHSLDIAAKIKHELKPSGGDANISIPTMIVSATLKDANNNETVLTPMTEQEYYAIGNKSSSVTGTPTKFYYERKLDVGNFYFNIYPSTTVQGWTCEIIYQQEADDLDAVGDDLDFPKEWMTPLELTLARALAPEYLGRVPQWLKDEQFEAVQEAVSFHPAVVTDDMYFQPGKD